MKLIQKIGVAKFKISTPGVPSSELELDFNPLITEFELSGNYTLIHWQARPKGHRQWGIYTSRDDTYRSTSELKINFATVESKQLDDATANSIPSAVLLVDEDSLTCVNERTIIGQPLLKDVA